MTTALAQLRAATAAEHERLETGLDVLRRCRDLTAYAALLQRFWTVHAGLEPRLADAAAAVAPAMHPPWTRPDVLGRLTDDLQLLGAEIPRQPVPVPALTGADEVWGCLYVVEGAALGGGLIAAELREVHGPDVPCRYFDGAGSERGRRWREFRRHLAAWLAAGGDAEVVHDAARRTFGIFEDHCILEEQSNHPGIVETTGRPQDDSLPQHQRVRETAGAAYAETTGRAP